MTGRPGKVAAESPADFFSPLHLFPISFVSTSGWHQGEPIGEVNERRERDQYEKDVKALKPHISINVRNVMASIEFYRKMLGIEPSKVRIGYAKFDVESG